MRVEHHPKPGTLGTFRIQKNHLCRNPASGDSLRGLDAASPDVPPLIKTSPRAIVVKKSFKTFYTEVLPNQNTQKNMPR